MAGSRSLPDLVARMLLDRSDFTAGVAASVRDVAGLDAATSKGSTGLLSLGNAHKTAASHATAQAQEIKKLETGLKDAERVVGVFERTLGSLGVSGETGIGRAAQQLAGATSGLGPAGAAIGIGLGGLAAGAGVGLVLEEMAKKQADFGFKTLAASQALGIESGELQGLQAWGQRFGIQAETMDTQLFRFNKTLGEGAPLLKAQGLSLQELGITSKDTATAYAQTADALAKITDSQQRAVIVQALFGRGGEQQLQALQQGGAAIIAYTKKLEDYGVILDKTTLNQDAMAHSAREDMGLALQGLENQFVAPLEQGFSLLDIVITKWAENGKNGMHAFGQAVSTVIGDVASLLNGLFGLGITSKDLSDAMHQQQEDAKASADAFKYAQTPIKDVTHAIQDQIKELQRSTQAYDESIDAKIRIEQASIKELDTEQQLMNLRRTAAADQAAITKTTQAITLATFQGDFAQNVTLGEQLTTEKQKQADDQTTAAIDAQKAQHQAVIDRYTEEKRVRDDTARDAVQKLQDELSAVKSTNSAIDDSNQQTATTGVVIFSGMTVTLSDRFTAFGVTIKKVLSDPFSPENQAILAKAAGDMGVKIGGALLNGIKDGILDVYSKNPWLKNFTILGLGEQVFSAAQSAVTAATTQRLNGPDNLGAGGTGPQDDATTHSYGTAGHFAAGGVLMEPVIGRGLTTGQSYSFAEQGPERILSAAETRQAAQGGGGGPVTNVFNFPNYTGSKSDLMTWVQQAIASTQMHA